MRQNRGIRLSRCSYRSEMEAKRQDKYVRSVCFDSLTDENAGNIAWGLVRAGAENVGCEAKGKGPVGRVPEWDAPRRRGLYTWGRRKAHSPLEAVQAKGWGTRGGCGMSRGYTEGELFRTPYSRSICLPDSSTKGGFECAHQRVARLHPLFIESIQAGPPLDNDSQAWVTHRSGLIAVAFRATCTYHTLKRS